MQKRKLGNSGLEVSASDLAACASLTPGDLREIDDAMSQITVVGARYQGGAERGKA
jgi:hypothetical protein